MSSDSAPVAIVGAGAAGLACATQLCEAGVPVRVFEASEAVGGRMRSDLVDGFRLDRGFQVLQTAYPEVRELLDLDALALGRFTPGALLRCEGDFARFVDPSRRLRELPRTLASGVMGFADQLRILSLRRHVTRGTLAELYARPERTTLAWLRERGFETSAIERFFRPFFAGVFLENALESSSRFFEFAFRHFAQGDAALPAEGMGAIPQQLAARLPEGTLSCDAPVETIEPGALRVAGARVEAAAVVVATDGETARRFVPSLPAVGFNATTCFWFACEEDPVGEPLLVLDADRSGPVNHLCVPSAVAPSYAPAGRALVAASVVGVPSTTELELERAVRAQLKGWFGGSVSGWRLLRIDRIERALPRQQLGWLDPVEREVAFGPRLFVAGDHRDMASLHGALHAGRRAARAVSAALGIPQERLAS